MVLKKMMPVTIFKAHILEMHALFSIGVYKPLITPFLYLTTNLQSPVLQILDLRRVISVHSAGNNHPNCMGQAYIPFRKMLKNFKSKSKDMGEVDLKLGYVCI